MYVNTLEWRSNCSKIYKKNKQKQQQKIKAKNATTTKLKDIRHFYSTKQKKC